MLYFFKILLLLINLNHETVLNWFKLANCENSNLFSYALGNDNFNLNLLNSSSDFKTNISFQNVKLIFEKVCHQIQEGLTLTDIENLLFFIIFLRFIILTIRYNLKTSFYITFIGIFAGYLWYRHLIDLISMYRSILIRLPYFHKLGVDAIQLRSMNRQIVLTDLKLGDNVHWYNPGQLIYYAFLRGMIKIDSETGFKYYIDPISMIISNLKESDKIKILPVYYKTYNIILPGIFESCSKFWTQLSGIAAYAVITRIGKKYCPYLVRWHWTFLLIIGFLEQILIYFVYRISYFQTAILLPKMQVMPNYIDQNLIVQITGLNGLLAFIVSCHLGFIFFGLFNAILGQYFYFPFLVENTELHIGPRPKLSIYSGGGTAWQDEKEKNIQKVFPKLWYGWFGNGTSGELSLSSLFQIMKANILKKIRK